MKKVLLLITTLVFAITLVGCTEDKVEITSLIGMEYGDALKWARENDIDLEVTSDYSDDVLPGVVFYQSIAEGEKVKAETTISIMYSRGLNPETEMDVPDFTGKTKDDIIQWAIINNITDYNFYDAFDTTANTGEYLYWDSNNNENRDSSLRKDTFNFYFAKGRLEIDEIDFFKDGTVRGVNLGGWFVLEGWMTPDLFQGVDGSDETAFMEQKENAAEVLENHWDTFITEDDFAFLADHGVEYVRIPIPWWLWGGIAYEWPGEEEVEYASSIEYLERAMRWAITYDIKVLLDLHTAPGCQNGFDNGGMSGIFEWYQNPEYVQMTVDVLEDIAFHFSGYSSLWGIEVLNEPAWAVDMGVLQQFYIDAYTAIRKHNPSVWVGFHDGFRGYMDYSWGPFFKNNDFENVFFDIHIYQIFGDFWSDFDIFDHLNWVEVENKKAIHRYDGIVPVIVGEWSLGLQGNVYENLDAQSVEDVKIAFANAQLNAYEEGMGWFFWNYKIDQNSHVEWDMQRLIEYGLFPDDFSDKD